MSKQLSKKMLEALLRLYEEHTCPEVDKVTIKALILRGLVNNEVLITPMGRITAIECLSLEKQCGAIAIAHNILPWDSSSTPEQYAYAWLAEQGHIGSYCEGGGFGTVIKALCLNELERNSIFYGSCINAREDVCLKGVVGLSQIDKSRLETIFKQIGQTTRTEYLSAFAEIISYSLIRDWCPGLTLEFAEALFDAVPKEHFVKLARWVSLDHSHRNGWPDLTLIKDGGLTFVEVKTTDKLHYSQLITIPAIIKEIGADISVLQLSHANFQ